MDESNSDCIALAPRIDHRPIKEGEKRKRKIIVLESFHVERRLFQFPWVLSHWSFRRKSIRNSNSWNGLALDGNQGGRGDGSTIGDTNWTINWILKYFLIYFQHLHEHFVMWMNSIKLYFESYYRWTLIWIWGGYPLQSLSKRSAENHRIKREFAK